MCNSLEARGLHSSRPAVFICNQCSKRFERPWSKLSKLQRAGSPVAFCSSACQLASAMASKIGGGKRQRHQAKRDHLYATDPAWRRKNIDKVLRNYASRTYGEYANAWLATMKLKRTLQDKTKGEAR